MRGAFFICGFLCLASMASADTVAVRAVVDGDTLLLVDGRKIRLVGINAPELGKGKQPDQPLAREARSLVTALVDHRPVKLKYGTHRYDHHGRTLAYVYNHENRSLGMALLRRGLAAMVAVPPNLAHTGSYQAAEQEAREAHKGIWGNRYYRPRPADSLARGDTGFRFVEGRIQRVGQSRKYVYLDLTAETAVVVDHRNWRYFGGDPRRLQGKRILVRGWFSLWRDKLRVRVGHPAMMEFLD